MPEASLNEHMPAWVAQSAREPMRAQATLQTDWVGSHMQSLLPALTHSAWLKSGQSRLQKVDVEVPALSMRQNGAASHCLVASVDGTETPAWLSGLEQLFWQVSSELLYEQYLSASQATAVVYLSEHLSVQLPVAHMQVGLASQTAWLAMVEQTPWHLVRASSQRHMLSALQASLPVYVYGQVLRHLPTDSRMHMVVSAAHWASLRSQQACLQTDATGSHMVSFIGLLSHSGRFGKRCGGLVTHWKVGVMVGMVSARQRADSVAHCAGVLSSRQSVLHRLTDGSHLHSLLERQASCV